MPYKFLPVVPKMISWHMIYFILGYSGINYSRWLTQVAPANLFLFELYHKSGILHFEEDHPGSPKPLSGKSKSSGFLRKSIFSTFFLVFWGPKHYILTPTP